MLNKAQQKSRGQKIAEGRIQLRTQLWSDLDEKSLWSPKLKGFTTIPRTLPYILQIMDELSNGKPVSTTYLALCSRSSDESLVIMGTNEVMAFESGFRGQRAEYVWKSRMKILCDFGFIDVKPGRSGEFSHVLILNPYNVIDRLNEQSKIKGLDTYFGFLERKNEIGALEA